MSTNGAIRVKPETISPDRSFWLSPQCSRTACSENERSPTLSTKRRKYANARSSLEGWVSKSPRYPSTKPIYPPLPSTRAVTTNSESFTLLLTGAEPLALRPMNQYSPRPRDPCTKIKRHRYSFSSNGSMYIPDRVGKCNGDVGRPESMHITQSEISDTIQFKMVSLGKHIISERRFPSMPTFPQPRSLSSIRNILAPSQLEPLPHLTKPGNISAQKELVLDQSTQIPAPGLIELSSRKKVDSVHLQVLVNIQLSSPYNNGALRRKFVLLIILVFRIQGLYDKILRNHNLPISSHVLCRPSPFSENINLTSVSLASHLAKCGFHGKALEEFVVHHIRCCKAQGVPAGTGI